MYPLAPAGKEIFHTPVSVSWPSTSTVSRCCAKAASGMVARIRASRARRFITILPTIGPCRSRKSGSRRETLRARDSGAHQPVDHTVLARADFADALAAGEFHIINLHNEGPVIPQPRPPDSGIFFGRRRMTEIGD